MAGLRRSRHWVSVRYVRNCRAEHRRASGAVGHRRFCTRIATVQPVDRVAPLFAVPLWRFSRADRRVSHRSFGPPPRARVEHCPLWCRYRRRGLCNLAAWAAHLALHDYRSRLDRVGRGGSLDRGAIAGSPTPRSRTRFHAGNERRRGFPGRMRVLLVSNVWAALARYCEHSCRLAVRADVRRRSRAARVARPTGHAGVCAVVAVAGARRPYAPELFGSCSIRGYDA